MRPARGFMPDLFNCLIPSVLFAVLALGESLALPEGWVYRTRVVDEDYVVVDQDGIATVVQDELQNTYQLAGAEE